MIVGHQHMVRAIIADLESTYGASAALPVTSHLAQADDQLRKLYREHTAITVGDRVYTGTQAPHGQGSRIDCPCWERGLFEQVPCPWHDGHRRYPTGAYAASVARQKEKRMTTEECLSRIDREAQAWPCRCPDPVCRRCRVLDPSPPCGPPSQRWSSSGISTKCWTRIRRHPFENALRYCLERPLSE